MQELVINGLIRYDLVLIQYKMILLRFIEENTKPKRLTESTLDEHDHLTLRPTLLPLHLTYALFVRLPRTRRSFG